MITKLVEFTDIHLGQPIRDKIENSPTGAYFIVQMKDVSRDSGVKVDTLYRVDLKGRMGPRLLKKGDILFVPRVFRESLPYCVLVNVNLPNLVAAPAFYILSVNQEVARPEFIHWLINSEPIGGKFFKRNAIGSSVLNIPKSVLSEMAVNIPPLQVQNRFIELIHAAKREKEIVDELMKKRRAFMDAVLNKYNE